jgi:hypothetical protein
MVGYIVPTLGAVAVFIFRKIWEKKSSVHSYRPNILLFGGAVFDSVDHVLNGELFLFGENTLCTCHWGL